MKKIAVLFLFIIMFCGIYLSVRQHPAVSVIMPTYNRAELLPRAIESILNQTYKDFEFIIVDDGSTDDTARLLKEYSDKDKRIRILRNEKNKGIAYSRQRGLDAARGKYIAVMDSDDWSVPERLQKQIDFMDKNPEIAVVVGMTKNISNGKVWERTTDPQEIIFRMHFNNVIGNPQTMIRHSFLTQNNIHYKMNYKASEDYDFFKQIIFAGGKIIRTHDVVVAVRYHSENSKEYYINQAINRSRVSKEFFKRYSINWPGTTKPSCALIEKMIENNAKAGLLTDDFLQEKKRQLCP